MTEKAIGGVNMPDRATAQSTGIKTTLAIKAMAQRQKKSRISKTSQPLTMQTVQATVRASFGGDSNSYQSGWISFGMIAFQERPTFVCGSSWVQPRDAPRLAEDASNLDTDLHIVVPAVAECITYKVENGYYRAAKVLCFALDSVPSGFNVDVGCIWMGVGIRRGD